MLTGSSLERLEHGWMRVDFGALVDQVTERRREDDAGQRGEARARRARKRSRLATSRHRVEHALIMEIHH